MVAVLGLGMFYMLSTSSSGGVGTNSQNRAYYLALAGKDYASAKWGSPLSGNFSLYNTDGSINGNFLLSITSNQITSTGIVSEARKTIRVQYSPGQSGGSGTTPPPFSFTGEGEAGMASLAPPVAGSGASGVSVDTVNKQINLGLGLSGGTAGCVWYQGWADSNASDCKAGRCNFNKGIRAYFDFQYNTSWEADGFTFAIISSHNNGTEASPAYINNVTDCGGNTNFGEYMGYAGGGTTGNGLQPPKIAVEFDPHIASTSDVCSSSNVPQGSSRKDSLFTSPQKHASFMYWGNNNLQCSSSQSNTYDDNRHGNGNGTTDPKNPTNGDTNPDGTTYPYMIRDYDTFGTAITSPAGRRLSFRLEIDRVDDTTSADYRKYKMRAWLKPYAVYTDSNGAMLDDTSKKFNKNGDYPPDLQQTITLTQTWHDKFDRILFGWTQATGGLTQTVVLRNFKIDFKNKNDF